MITSYIHEYSGFITPTCRQMLAGSLFADGVLVPQMWVGLLLGQPSSTDNASSVQEIPADLIDPVTYIPVPTGYARALCPRLTDDDQSWWVTHPSGDLTSSQPVEFPVALTDWGLVRAWGLFTEATGGMLLAAGPAEIYVRGPQPADDDDQGPPDTGDQVVIPAGGISFSVVSNG